MTRLHTLQRKARFERWKYAIATLLLSLAGIGVTLSNSQHSMPLATPLIEDSATPVQSTAIAETPGIDFFAIIVELDEIRNEAFRSRNLDALLKVSAPNSPQLFQDQKILKQIINEDLSVTFALPTLISVKQVFNASSDEVQLEVLDQKENIQRAWMVKLIRQSDGSWRYFEVTSIPLSAQIQDLDE